MSDPKPAAGTAPAAPVLEPTTQRFIDGLAAAGGPPIYTLGPEAARAVLAGAQAGPVAAPAARVEDATFPVGPTGSVRVRIVRPEGVTGALPAVMYFPGGGWVLGDRNTHDRLVRVVAAGAEAAVVFVDYDRSPEARYPPPIEQAYAATRHVAGNGPALDLDPSRLAVAGDSVGGNMAAAVTLLAKERGGPRIGF
ncbi:MAG TPA: alpha/beta hydrolase, partial [Geminicoccaceae bacterium]|nr:alpha/beta hydrolase [Geminicoccaceae bacterium]